MLLSDLLFSCHHHDLSFCTWDQAETHQTWHRIRSTASDESLQVWNYYRFANELTIRLVIRHLSSIYESQTEPIHGTNAILSHTSKAHRKCSITVRIRSQKTNDLSAGLKKKQNILLCCVHVDDNHTSLLHCLLKHFESHGVVVNQSLLSWKRKVIPSRANVQVISEHESSVQFNW